MNQAQLAVNPDNYSLAERYLALVCERSPVIKRTLEIYGELTLEMYVQRMLSISKSPLQPREDLMEAVYRYAAPLLGKRVAEQAALELQTLPAVLTANHHGVDFLAQSVQGGLIFSMREVGGKPATTVPVFACGNVALNNPTYPQGLLLYHKNWPATELTLPIKLPVFSNRYKRQSVSIAAAYDTTMLARTEQRLQNMLQNKQLTPTLAAAVRTILEEDYQNGAIMGLPNYSQQAVVLNHRIWKRCFREPAQMPEMVYLELEKITNMLLQLDLDNEDSLMWQIMFNQPLRTEVLRQLDGAKACWDQGKLSKRIQVLGADGSSAAGCGTVFFWGIDAAGRRIPLFLTNGVKHPVLQGRDDRGTLWTIPFTPQDVLQGLRKNLLLPSLFTCYSTIGFARGISCCGGYYQADYLAYMQNCLVRTFQSLTGFAEFAEHLSQVPSGLYLSGMQAVMSKTANMLLPAGPIAMVARKGLTTEEIESLRKITVRDAHLAGLMETLPDMQGSEDLPTDWYFLLAQENCRLLHNRVLIMDLSYKG